MFLAFLKIPIFILCVVCCMFTLAVAYQYLLAYRRGKRLKKGTHKPLKPRSMFKRLFIDFPKQFVIDLFNRDPDFFKYQGLIIFTGRQGAGKTNAMIQAVRNMQYEYPLAKVMTNLKYTHQDEEITHWKKLVFYKNGIYGVIAALDELQNWFSSNQSKNFPPEMLEVITQNRKNRRVILGTAQNFYLLAKAIRSQCTEVRECKTFFGCITVVHRREPVVDSEGKVEKWNHLGWYFYVHDEFLRNSYDTYRVIESLSKSGFKDEPIALQPEITVVK